MFNLAELVRPLYCLGLLAGLTHLTCLSRSHMKLQFHSRCLPVTFLLSPHYSRFLSQRSLLQLGRLVALRQQVLYDSKLLRLVQLQCMS
jgi:hypothetical protein